MSEFDALIEKIGDPFFSLACEDSQNPSYPEVVNIIDCEDEITISVACSDLGNSLESAEALVVLLNGMWLYSTSRR